MARIVYDDKAMKFMALFERITRADLKDCIIGDVIIFIVKENEI